MAEEKRADMPHNLIIEGRGRVSLSGVTDVENFDENTISLTTTKGYLILKGERLHIEKLSLESGEMWVDGEIHGLTYEDSVPTGGFFARLFG